MTPLKIMIRGIQSNLVNGIIWFIIKPNYFLSINDQNISLLTSSTRWRSRGKKIFQTYHIWFITTTNEKSSSEDKMINSFELAYSMKQIIWHKA